MLRLHTRSGRRDSKESNELLASPPLASCNPEPAMKHLDQPIDAEVPTPPFLSLREAADWLCVSSSTLKRMIAQGLLPTIRIGTPP